VAGRAGMSFPFAYKDSGKKSFTKNVVMFQSSNHLYPHNENSHITGAVGL